MLAVESGVSPLRVNELVQDCVSVRLVTRCEDGNLEAHFLTLVQRLNSEGSHVYASLHQCCDRGGGVRRSSCFFILFEWHSSCFLCHLTLLRRLLLLLMRRLVTRRVTRFFCLCDLNFDQVLIVARVRAIIYTVNQGLI